MAIVSVSITEAAEVDIPFLTEIITYSHMGELIMPFFFKDWPRTTTIKPYFTARLYQKIMDPDSKLYKASDSVTNEILGFVSLTLERDKEDVEQNITNPAGFKLPPDFDMAFAGEVLQKLEKLDNVMKGRNHYMDPKTQGRGIGTKLINHCAELADAKGLPIWLTAFPGAHELYLRIGYKDVANCGIDLNEWGRKGRGYGVYTSYGMIREPVTK